MDFILRVITEGGELVRTTDLGNLDEVTAFAHLAAEPEPGEGEVLQLIGDDRILAEIAR